LAGITYDAKDDEIAKAFADAEKAMAKAATAAVLEVGESAKHAVRQNIAEAGFSNKWQNAFRARYYPEGRESLRAAAFLHHNICYAGVFEEGETITGKPLLWLPLPDTPKTFGDKKTTPRIYAQRVGKLRSVNRPGKPPLLFGPKPGDPKASVPLFIGIRAVNIGKKFDIYRTIQTEASKLPAAYDRHLKAT
jgi:hypothetical protein